MTVSCAGIFTDSRSPGSASPSAVPSSFPATLIRTLISGIVCVSAFQCFLFDRVPIRPGHRSSRSALQCLAKFGFQLAFGPPLLGIANEGTKILAGRGIALLGHLSFDKAFISSGTEMFIVVISLVLL